MRASMTLASGSPLPQNRSAWLWLLAREKGEVTRVVKIMAGLVAGWPHSMLGSLRMFTPSPLQTAAYVKALGQID